MPDPQVELNPPADPFQVVNFPTWWWINNFEPVRSERVEAGAVWARAMATPIYSVFNGGQGDSERCNSAGIKWRRGLPGDYERACTYTFKKADEELTATVTVRWRVTWVGSGGSGGTLPVMQTETEIPLTVYERQAVNVPYGS